MSRSLPEREKSLQHMQRERSGVKDVSQKYRRSLMQGMGGQEQEKRGITDASQSRLDNKKFCHGKGRNWWQEGLLGGYVLNYHKQSFSEAKLRKVYCMYIQKNNVFKSQTFKIPPIIIMSFKDHWFDTEGTTWEKNI